MGKSQSPACESCQSRDFSVFSKLPQNELISLTACKKYNRYNKGHFLFRPADEATGVFCISQGTIMIYSITHNGNLQIIQLAGAGDLVAYEAVLAATNHKHFAKAIDDSLICFIPKNHFMQMLEENHPLEMVLMQKMSLEVINSDKRITSMTTKAIRERVAESLLYLNQFFQCKSTHEGNRAISLSSEDIASYTGATPETVGRILRDFEKAKLIKWEKHVIRILNFNEISKIASSL